METRVFNNLFWNVKGRQLTTHTQKENEFFTPVSLFSVHVRFLSPDRSFKNGFFVKKET